MLKQYGQGQHGKCRSQFLREGGPTGPLKRRLRIPPILFEVTRNYLTFLC